MQSKTRQEESRVQTVRVREAGDAHFVQRFEVLSLGDKTLSCPVGKVGRSGRFDLAHLHDHEGEKPHRPGHQQDQHERVVAA